MLNPENKPTNRILTNGGRMPTSEGLVRTPEERKKISDALSKVPKPDYLVIPHITTWAVIRPFVLRNGIPVDIADITDLTQQQIQSVVNNKRRKLFSVDDYLSAEKRKVRKRRAHYRGLTQELSMHEQKSIIFTKKLNAMNLFGDETSSWNSVNVLIQKQDPKRKPEHLAYVLMLEAFWVARLRANSGDRSLLDEYIRLGRRVDHEWFKSEELSSDRRLINEALAPPDRGREGNQFFLSEGIAKAVDFFAQAGVPWRD